VRLDSGGGVFTNSSGEITIDTTETLEIIYRVSTDNGNNSRATTRTFLERDTGGGFALAQGFTIVDTQLDTAGVMLHERSA